MFDGSNAEKKIMEVKGNSSPIISMPPPGKDHGGLHNLLIGPAITKFPWGKRGFGEVGPLNSHDNR